MDLRHMRCFAALARELHFGRAAERLGMAQSALSANLRALEDDLDARLFDRTTRRVELTQAGRALLPKAQAVLAGMEDARAAVLAETTRARPVLRVGGVDSATFSVIPAAIRRVKAQRAQAEFSVREMLTAPALHALEQRQIDFAFVRRPATTEGLVSDLIRTEPCVAVLPTGHPLAGHDDVPVEALGGLPLVLPPRVLRPIHHDILQAWFRDHGLTMSVAQEAHERHTILGLVAAGLGISILPAWIRSLHHPDIVYRDIEGTPPLLDVHFVRRDEALDEAGALFSEVVLGG